MVDWIVIGIGFLGLIPMLLVLWKHQQVKKLIQTGELVTGLVEDIQERHGLKGNRYYLAMIRYTPIGRSTIRGAYYFTAARHLPLFVKGSQVDLYYNKEKPEKFILVDIRRGKGFLVFTIILAVAYLAICFFLYEVINKGN